MVGPVACSSFGFDSVDSSDIVSIEQYISEDDIGSCFDTDGIATGIADECGGIALAHDEDGCKWCTIYIVDVERIGIDACIEEHGIAGDECGEFCGVGGWVDDIGIGYCVR